MTTAFVNSVELTVTWGDCDPAGIVFYPNYFRMFNMATDSLFAAAGFPIGEIMTEWDIIGYPMIETGAKFSLPNRYGDLIRIDSKIAGWRNSSFDVEHRVFNSHGLSIEAVEKRLFAFMTDAGTLKGRAVQGPIRERMIPVG